MRFAPAAAALSLALTITGSVAYGEDQVANPRAIALIAEGDAVLMSGDPQTAIDAYEAALTIDPAYSPIYLRLAQAARAEGLQGKAIGYYREVLERDPANFAAIGGEGAALAEKGAIEKARQKLTRLQSLCGENCPEAGTLSLAIERAANPAPALAAETSGEAPTPN